MKHINEEAVTKILSVNEIIHNTDNIAFETSAYNLGDFLKNYKPELSLYEGKYVFIR